MEFQIVPTEDARTWRIESNTKSVGSVEQLMTGFLVTYNDKKTKRYRMKDALREALGDDADIKMPNQP